MPLSYPSPVTVTMQQVADHAGVSLSTVSRVFNGHPRINQDTRQLVYQSMQMLGYKPRFLEQITEVNRNKQQIAIWMCPLPEQRDPLGLNFFSLLVSGVRDGLDQNTQLAGLEILPAHLSFPPNSDKKTANFPISDKINGVVLVGYSSESLRETLKQRGIPYVIASCDMLSCEGENLVSSNNFEAGVIGCRCLLQRGVKRIGFLIGTYLLGRYAGFVAEMIKQNIVPNQSDLHILANTEYDVAVEGLQKLIAAGDLPDALVVSCASISRLYRPILNFNNIRVPEDLCLLGFSYFNSKPDQSQLTNTEVSSDNLLRPGQSFRQPPADKYDGIDLLYIDPYAIGKQASRRLLKIIRRTDEPPVHILLSMTFLPGDTITTTINSD